MAENIKTEDNTVTFKAFVDTPIANAINWADEVDDTIILSTGPGRRLTDNNLKSKDYNNIANVDDIETYKSDRDRQTVMETKIKTAAGQSRMTANQQVNRQSTSKSIFGEAKPVDTRRREKQVELRLEEIPKKYARGDPLKLSALNRKRRPKKDKTNREMPQAKKVEVPNYAGLNKFSLLESSGSNSD